MRKGLVACAALFACGSPARPPPVLPTLAGDTKDLSICWRGADAGDAPLERGLRDALARRLRSAGYTLLASSCDVGLQVSWSVSDGDFRAVRVAMRDADDTLLAPILVSFAAGEMPVTDTDRLATTIVNHVNASATLAFVAQNRREISIGETGVTIRQRARASVQSFDIDRIKRTFAALPQEKRIDVTIEPYAQWQAVVRTFDVLQASGRAALRVHANGDTADLDLAKPEPWTGKGTWLSLAVSRTELVGAWSSDRPCAQLPLGFSTRSRKLGALDASVRGCAEWCVERLQLAGTAEDSTVYLEALMVAARATKRPVQVDVHGQQQPQKQCTNEVDALLEAQKDAIRACAPAYHGVIRAVVHVSGTSAEAVTVLFVDVPEVPDPIKTCVARVIERASFPSSPGTVRYVHAFDL